MNVCPGPLRLVWCPTVRRQTVDERRAEILETTCEVVIERGFAATRISDVAHKLGVSTGLIHYHFENKELLLAEAFKFAARQDIDRVAARVDEVPTALAKLDRIFQLWAPEQDDYAWMLWIDSWGEALRNEAMQKISQELDIQSKGQLEAIIREGVASMEFRCDDPNGAAWRLSALADGLAIQMAAHSGIVSRAAHRTHLRTAALAELGLPADAFASKASKARRK
ncbi:MAG: TetR family transcriptional regulator [Actinobacteria bacterium]|nr:TetR family transcriptional regulator [Actinomycetota bacterium]